MFVCILSLCSFGCSSDDPENNDGSEINGANGTEKSQPIDACSLITKAEAEAAEAKLAAAPAGAPQAAATPDNGGKA